MMLKFVAGKKWLSKVEDPDAIKRLKEEETNQWLEKPLHARFLQDTEKVSTERMTIVKGGHVRKKLR